MLIVIGVDYISGSPRVAKSFGRSNSFYIYDVNNKTLKEKITNHFRTSIGGELFAARILIKRNINIVVSNHCEPDAKKLFESAGIEIIENVDSPSYLFLDEFYAEQKKKELVEIDRHFTADSKSCMLNFSY
jgi:predicted Fe-Mo cluster-binding NifX family protein